MGPPSTARREKRRLREQCLSRRRALAPGRVAAWGRAIRARVLGLQAFRDAALVHTYVSSKDNEVDTHRLIRDCLEHGKQVAVPVVVPGTRELAHARITDVGQLRPGRWGLWEPAAAHEDWISDVGRIDLVIVPGLAFDPGGRRLGLGGGYYDRFLARVRAVRVGLAYDELILAEVPREEHDMAVDLVVTESRTLWCKEDES